MRSNWKLPFADSYLFFDKTNTFSRTSVILPCFVGSTLNIHNGSNFIKINIHQEIVGHKIGEFCRTRARYEYKKGKKK
jgi:small subunit ribosomal protein S19